MGGFAPINTSGQGGYAGGGGILGFLTKGLQGYEEAHKGKIAEGEEKQRYQAEKKKTALDQQQETEGITHDKLVDAGLTMTMQQQQQQAAREQAQSVNSNLIQTISSHPEAGNDPSFQQSYINNANILGIPVVRNKDGTVNWDAALPIQFSQLKPEEKAYYASLGPQARKEQMKGIGGVDPEFLKLPAVKTPDQIKADAALQGAQTRSKAETHKEYIDDQKLAPWKRYENAKTALTQDIDSTSKAKAYATINELNANAGRATAEAQAIPARLALEGQSLELRSGELSVAMQRLQYDTSPDSIKNLHTTTEDLTHYTDSVQTQLDSAEKSLATYLAAKTTGDGTLQPDDAVGQQLSQNIHRLNDQLYKAQRASDKAQSALRTHMYQGTQLTRQSGNKSTTILPRKNSSQTQNPGKAVGRAPAGTKDGTTTQYNGQTLTARGGVFYAPGQ